jgi:hypothetical protein
MPTGAIAEGERAHVLKRLGELYEQKRFVRLSDREKKSVV